MPRRVLKDTFRDVKVGDTVTRLLGDQIAMRLTVVKVTETRITCGPYDWTFDRTFGYEIDPDLGWGVKGVDGVIRTGSWLIKATLDSPFVKFCPRCEARLDKLRVGWRCSKCDWKDDA